MDWREKIQVKKGAIGESIVMKKLEERGYIVYAPITESAHAFDFLAIKDKKIFKIAEIKSKARLNKYEATGIDIRHFNEYLYIYENQNIDIILFFIDEHPKEERIYCQNLSELIKPKTINGIEFPNTNIVDNIILFSLSEMQEVCKLTENEICELKKYSSRNYEYK